MKKRKMVSWILAVSVAGMLAGCGSSTTSNNAGTTAAAETKTENTSDKGTESVVELSLADAQPDGCAANISMKAMVDEIAEKSGGSVKVTY